MFQDFKGMSENVTAGLKATPLQAFADTFQRLFKLFEKFIQVHEDYFEQK
jgi:hypothetical protein